MSPRIHSDGSATGPARLFDQPFVLSVGGVDLAPYVQSIDIERDIGWEPSDAMSLKIEVSGPADVIMGRMNYPDSEGMARAEMSRARAERHLGAARTYQPGPDGMCVCATCRGATPPAPVPEADHEYVQDPESLLHLCQDCGMWPDHHNHHVVRGIRCVCQECRPADQPGGANSLPPEHSEYGRYAGEGAHP